VSYVETSQVKVGVECDVYAFINDDSRDLAIIRIKAGCSSPHQRIKKGTKTVQGFLEGEATLSIGDVDGGVSVSYFNSRDEVADNETEVRLGKPCCGRHSEGIWSITRYVNLPLRMAGMRICLSKNMKKDRQRPVLFL